MRHEPGSVGQRLLWLLDHYRGGESALNEQVVWRMRGDCDVPALKVALADLIRRHESLRTTFAGRAQRLTQVVHEPREAEIVHHDVSTQDNPVAALRSLIGVDVQTPIDPAVWPLRATLIRLADDEHAFIITMHHFVTDDWSNALISRDIRALYARATGADEPLPDVDWQYADWSRWQHEVLSGDGLAKLTDYWSGKLAGARLVELPPPPPAAMNQDDPPWISVEYPIDPVVTKGLRKLAREHRTTLFPIMLAMFYVLLHRRTGERDLTIGSLFANRTRPEVRETVGFFVSMVLMRGQVEPGAPFGELVKQVRTTVMDAMRHQDLPYQLLPPNTLAPSSGRADDVMFQLLGSFVPRADMAGDELDDLEAQLERRRFALEFVLVPTPDDGLAALGLCARERFDPAWIDQLVRDYVALAADVVSGAEVPQ